MSRIVQLYTLQLTFQYNNTVLLYSQVATVCVFLSHYPVKLLTLPSYIPSLYSTELYHILIQCQNIYSQCIKSKQFPQAKNLTTGAIMSPCCNKYPRRCPEKCKNRVEDPYRLPGPIAYVKTWGCSTPLAVLIAYILLVYNESNYTLS